MFKTLALLCLTLAGLTLCWNWLLVEKPGWFNEQCTFASDCTEAVLVDAAYLLKTKFNTPRITENSGLISSRNYSDTIWTHNDSGSHSFLYAVDSNGNLMGSSWIVDSWPYDWEDIASDPHGNLYMLDYSLNQSSHQTIIVVPEPNPQGFSLSFTSKTLHFNLPDQARATGLAKPIKAEALFWANESLYLLTKEMGSKQTVLYRFPDTTSDIAITLEKISTFDIGGEPDRFGGMVTAADLTPDGQHLVVLTYMALYFFEQPAQGDDYLRKPMGHILINGKAGQAEGVSWDNGDVLISSENGYFYRIKNALSLINKK